MGAESNDEMTSDSRAKVDTRKRPEIDMILVNDCVHEMRRPGCKEEETNNGEGKKGR